MSCAVHCLKLRWYKRRVLCERIRTTGLKHEVKRKNQLRQHNCPSLRSTTRTKPRHPRGVGQGLRIFTEHHSFWTNLTITGLRKGTKAGVVTILYSDYIIWWFPWRGWMCQGCAFALSRMSLFMSGRIQPLQC
jgi:hypothetical protein